MKVQPISTALSLLVLTAMIPQTVLAAGDSNIDSGVGSAASRGPYGFNNTGHTPIYDTPPNDYGIWRDAYGGLRDAGMQPDNLTTAVHQPTWEDTHPVGPPQPMGSPGGLGGGGFAGLGGGFGGVGIGFGLGAGTGAFGAFTGVSPLAAAATAGLTNGLPVVGGSGLGPFGSAPRSAFGFAGSPGTFFPNHPFLGGVNAGPLSGFVVNPKVTSSNVTQNGMSTTTTSWNTTFGPAQFQQITTGSGNNANTNLTLTLNGNVYSASVQGPPPNVNNGSFFGLSNVPIPLNNPAPNSTVTATFNTNNASVNPAMSPGAFFNPHATVQQGAIGNFGASAASPATSGSPSSFFWTNTPQQGNFGGGFATPQTAGAQSSVFFNGSFGSTTIGGGFATNATSGSARATQSPNLDIGNAIGVGGGNLGSVAFGFPGFGTPNIASTSPGLSGGFGTAGGGGFLGGGFGGLAGAPIGPVGAITEPTSSTIVNNNNVETGPIGSTFNNNGASFSQEMEDWNGAGFSTDVDFWGPAGVELQSNLGTGPLGYGLPGVGRFGLPPLRGPIGMPPSGYVGGGGGARLGNYGPMSMGAYPGMGAARLGPGSNQAFGPMGMGAVGNQGNGAASKWTTSYARTMGAASPGQNSKTKRVQRKGERLLVAPIGGVLVDNADGANGFLGGEPAMEEALNQGFTANFPYVGNSPTPGGVFAAGRRQRILNENQARSVSGVGPIGNTTTQLESKLADLNLSICNSIGTVIGSTRFDNGDILTYGSAGTLRLAADNSGSITFNDGEILTFRCADPEVRAVALKSTLLF